MKIETKKIIAKEGLIFLFISFLAFIFTYLYHFVVPVGITKYRFTERDFTLSIEQVFSQDIFKNLLLIYLFYFLFRFILWSIKTLKRK